MTGRLRACVLGAVLALAVVPAAAAGPLQPAGGHRTRITVFSVSAGAQMLAANVSDRFELERNIETASVNVGYPGPSGTLFDGGVAVQLWKQIGAGVSVSRFSGSGSATVDATIPHPFLFQQPRAVSGNESGIRRAETGVHLQLQYAVVITRRIVLAVSAGPSWIAVEQDLVHDVRYDEAYPYDTATFRSAPIRRSRASAAGVNAGADLRWMFDRRVGIGGLVRLTHGAGNLETPDNRLVRAHSGGVQAAAGLRVEL